MISIAVYQ